MFKEKGNRQGEHLNKIKKVNLKLSSAILIHVKDCLTKYDFNFLILVIDCLCTKVNNVTMIQKSKLSISIQEAEFSKDYQYMIAAQY